MQCGNRSSIDKNQKKGVVTASTVLVFLAACVLGFLIMVTMTQQGENCIPMITSNSNVIGETLEILIEFILAAVLGLTFLSILTANGLIIQKLRQRNNDLDRNERQATISLVLIGFSFLVNNFVTVVASVAILRTSANYHQFNESLDKLLLTINVSASSFY